jgi:pyruvate kinase
LCLLTEQDPKGRHEKNQTARPANQNSITSGLSSAASSLAKKLGLAGPGDLIVITGGVPLGLAGTTNLLKVEVVR